MTMTIGAEALKPTLESAFLDLSSRKVEVAFEPGHQKLHAMLSEAGAQPLRWFTQVIGPLGKPGIWVGMRESERAGFGALADSVGLEGDSFLRNVLKSFLSSLGHMHGQTWTAESGEWSSSFPTDAELLKVALSAAGAEGAEFLIALGPDLSKPAPAPPPAPKAAEPALSGAMQVLLDVELPVLISFGSVEMQLKDVLRLSTGTMVELDHAVDDPVDIIVKNTIVARGQLVSVDGRYGVKIEEIVSGDKSLGGAEENSLRALASALAK